MGILIAPWLSDFILWGLHWWKRMQPSSLPLSIDWIVKPQLEEEQSHFTDYGTWTVSPPTAGPPPRPVLCRLEKVFGRVSREFWWKVLRE